MSACTRSDFRHRNNYADRIQSVVTWPGEILPRNALFDHPRTYKVVLNECGPAVIRLFRVFDLSLVHVLEIYFRELGFLGVDCSTGKRGPHFRIAGGRITISQKLKISMAQKRRVAGVVNLVVNINDVIATMKGVAQQNTASVDRFSFQNNLQLLVIAPKFELATHNAVLRRVIGQTVTNQAALRYIGSFIGNLEQEQIAVRIIHTSIFEQLQPSQYTAQRIDVGFKHVRSDSNDPRRWRRGRRRSDNRCRRTRIARRGHDRRNTAVGRNCRHNSTRCRLLKRRRLIRLEPGVSQQHY